MVEPLRGVVSERSSSTSVLNWWALDLDCYTCAPGRRKSARATCRTVTQSGVKRGATYTNYHPGAVAVYLPVRVGCTMNSDH